LRMSTFGSIPPLLSWVVYDRGHAVDRTLEIAWPILGPRR
jgi:hypothetical protein